jgi:succinate dehydrogenase/fumarate reductase flavoprotein subunit
MAELAWLAGCRFVYVPQLGGHVPVHSDHMETTVPGLFVAGDVSGVEEASSAMEEGRLAGLWAAADAGRLDSAEAARLGARHQAALDHLRCGPFGESTRRGKQAMMAQSDRARSQLLTRAGA